MGLSASLFYSSNSDVQTLYRRITPSDKQFEQQQERWNNLADFLLDDLSMRTELVSRSWLQGSYKFGTQVRPAKSGDEFDIDLGVYLEWEGDPQAGPFGARDLKRHVQSGLEEYGKDNDDVLEVTVPKERCGRIRFKGNFHIDVPSYHLDPEMDKRSLATQSGAWENSDPKAIYLWFRNKFDDYDRAKVRRHICYLKMWAALNCDDESRASSITLTVLVANAYKAISVATRASDDDCFAAIVEYIHNVLTANRAVINPTNTKENLNRLSEEGFARFSLRLRELCEVAEAALKAGSRAEAAELWAEAFAHFFPAPEADEEVGVSKALVPVVFDPFIEVVATTKGLNPRQFTGANSIGPIPRNCDLKFRLANVHQLPPQAIVRWTVRNEGEEAEEANDLGHVRSTTGHLAEERSAYKGTHHMDVAVFQYGRLIGRRRVPVTIQGLAMPPRNAPSKRKF